LLTPASVVRLIHRDDWKQLRRTYRQAGQGADSYQIEFRVCRPNGEVRWCLGTAVVSMDAARRITRASGVTIDITDRKEAEERQSLLAREVDHRAKNALAVVQAIVHLTRSENIKQFVVAVEGRIQALARAHSLLSESRWRGADIGTLVREELAPYRTPEIERVLISGKDFSLEPATAQAVALALHELATNAVKYGALSSPSGHIRIDWELLSSGFDLHWTECDGPAVEHPTAAGFGIRVVKTSIGSQLGGKVEFDWRADGLRCDMHIPHQVKMEFPRPPRAPPRAPVRQTPPQVRGGTRKRILLLEDETMIAMVMAQTLTELGFEVVGPFGDVAEAIAALDGGPIDAGLLDINLGNEMGYPVAHALQARRVPFVFMTGYGTESISPQFTNVPVVQKPVSHDVLQEVLTATFAKGDRRQDSLVQAVG
jgi:two-component sensor histidine kinase